MAVASGRGLRSAATVVVGMVVALLVVVPILVMVRTVWVEGRGRLGELLTADGLGEALLNTVLLAAVVTVLAVPLGAWLALSLRRRDLPGRGFWQVAVLLPVLVPDFVLAYSWVSAYGRAGFTDDLLGLDWQGLQGPVGVAVVLVVNAAPLAYLTVAVGLAARAEPDLERAARVSGATPTTVLRTVTLPLLRPALAASAVLVFVLTLASFAIPLVLGAPVGFTTVTTRIYANLTRASDPAAFIEAITLALLLVLLAVLIVAPADAVLGPRLRVSRTATAQGAARAAGGRTAGTATALAVAAYLGLAVALPLLALVGASVTAAVGLPPTPANWTLDNFASVVTQRNLEALGRSMVLAVAAASVLTLLGGTVAALERSSRSGRGAATLVTLTLVLPGSTLAVGLLISYGQVLGGSLMIILLAYVAKLWAFAHRPVSGALDRLPSDELHASRASGATPLTMIRTVALRPLAPALLGAWLICFLVALHEVTMSSLLYGPGSETLAVVVLNSQQLGDVGSTAALAVAITVLTLLPALVVWAALRQLRGPRPGRTTPEHAHA